MYQIDFNKPIHIHFIGIGGISMSGLAELLLSENFKISGSDNKESDKRSSQPSVSQEHMERQPQHQCSVRYSCQQAPTQRYPWAVCSHRSEAI